MGSQSQSVVLIVEEEPLLRLAAIDMVEEAGFVALEARDAGQALSMLEDRSDVDIVFTDLDIEKPVDGQHFAKTVRDRFPKVGLIVTSSVLAGAPAGLAGGTPFFPKPYSDRAVLDAMQALAA